MEELLIALTCWVFLGWISGIILTIWDYNDGEPISLNEIFLIIFLGGLAGFLVFFYMMGQYPEHFKKTKLSKYLNKPIWQKKAAEK